LRIWLDGGYAELIERDLEYLSRVNVAEHFQRGDVPTQFHSISRYPKGQYKYTDERALWFVTATLKRCVAERGHTPYSLDETFGLLSFSPDLDRSCAQCEGWVVLDVFENREASLLIDAELTGPTHLQRQWYCEFLQRQGELREPIEAAILTSYHHLCDRAGWQPAITTRDQLLEQINPGTLYIMSSNDDPLDIDSLVGELFWETSWDDEHGIRVRLNRDFQIFDVE
jgi:hypothetical protein